MMAFLDLWRCGGVAVWRLGCRESAFSPSGHLSYVYLSTGLLSETTSSRHPTATPPQVPQVSIHINPRR
jgi:hypothetical protein